MAASLAETCKAMVEHGEENPDLLLLLCLEELIGARHVVCAGEALTLSWWGFFCCCDEACMPGAYNPTLKSWASQAMHGISASFPFF